MFIYQTQKKEQYYDKAIEMYRTTGYSAYRLKKLRAELLNAEIKAEAYNELINVAEAKFGIQIRKKAGAKQ